MFAANGNVAIDVGWEKDVTKRLKTVRHIETSRIVDVAQMWP